MWKLFGGGKGAAAPGSGKKNAMDHMLQTLNQSDAERPLPTLVCRQCGLKYNNTGTFLKGSRCPECYPGG